MMFELELSGVVSVPQKSLIYYTAYYLNFNIYYNQITLFETLFLYMIEIEILRKIMLGNMKLKM